MQIKEAWRRKKKSLPAAERKGEGLPARSACRCKQEPLSGHKCVFMKNMPSMTSCETGSTVHGPFQGPTYMALFGSKCKRPSHFYSILLQTLAASEV